MPAHLPKPAGQNHNQTQTALPACVRLRTQKRLCGRNKTVRLSSKQIWGERVCVQRFVPQHTFLSKTPATVLSNASGPNAFAGRTPLNLSRTQPARGCPMNSGRTRTADAYKRQGL